MSSENRIYIARQYSRNPSLSYHFEGAFSSYEAAYENVKKLVAEEEDAGEYLKEKGFAVGDDNFPNFLYEIVSYVIDDDESWKEGEQIWTFDATGKLVDSYDARKRYDDCFYIDLGDDVKEIYREPKPENYTGKFEVGDIVLMRAYPWNKESCTSVDTVGVVSMVPEPFHEWVADPENCRYGWNDTYAVDFIDQGYLNHVHVIEKALEAYTEDIPESLIFLKRLSDHYSGRKKISEEVLSKIYDGEIFVENVRHLTDEYLDG